MNCYVPRDGTRAAVGGQFNINDDSYRMIPDRCLLEATIDRNNSMLKLYYSTWTIEISGYRLRKLYEDTVEGRLGKVTIAYPSDDIEAEKAAETNNLPFVTGITHLSLLLEAAHDIK